MPQFNLIQVEQLDDKKKFQTQHSFNNKIIDVVYDTQKIALPNSHSNLEQEVKFNLHMLSQPMKDNVKFKLTTKFVTTKVTPNILSSFEFLGS